MRFYTPVMEPDDVCEVLHLSLEELDRLVDEGRITRRSCLHRDVVFDATDVEILGREIISQRIWNEGSENYFPNFRNARK
jgi:hypothetical protein